MKRAGDFSELLPATRQNLNQPVGPDSTFRRVPGRRHAGAERQLHAVHHAARPGPRGLVPAPKYVMRPTATTTCSALQPTNREDLKVRVDYNISNNTKAYVRAPSRRKKPKTRAASGGRVGCRAADADLRHEHGRSVVGNVVTVLSPTMTNEASWSWSRLTLDDLKDPSKMRKSSVSVWSSRRSSPVRARISRASSGLGRRRGQPVVAGKDMYAHNDELSSTTRSRRSPAHTA